MPLSLANKLRPAARATLVCAAMVLALPATTIAAEADDLAAAEAATDGFHDVGAAEDAGYALPAEGPLHECISSLDGTGAMGLHYINGDLVGDTELDPASPEVLVYQPDADGNLSLVALEFVVFADAWDAENDAPPALFEREFMFTDEPNRYELPPFYSLHAWIWKDNPEGTYAPFNPDVSCPPDELPNAAMPAPITPFLPSGGGALLLVAAGAVAWRRRLTSRRLN